MAPVKVNDPANNGISASTIAKFRYAQKAHNETLPVFQNFANSLFDATKRSPNDPVAQSYRQTLERHDRDASMLFITKTKLQTIDQEKRNNPDDESITVEWRSWYGVVGMLMADVVNSMKDILGNEKMRDFVEGNDEVGNAILRRVGRDNMLPSETFERMIEDSP